MPDSRRSPRLLGQSTPRACLTNAPDSSTTRVFCLDPSTGPKGDEDEHQPSANELPDSLRRPRSTPGSASTYARRSMVAHEAAKEGPGEEQMDAQDRNADDDQRTTTRDRDVKGVGGSRPYPEDSGRDSNTGIGLSTILHPRVLWLNRGWILPREASLHTLSWLSKQAFTCVLRAAVLATIILLTAIVTGVVCAVILARVDRTYCVSMERGAGEGVWWTWETLRAALRTPEPVQRSLADPLAVIAPATAR